MKSKNHQLLLLVVSVLTLLITACTNLKTDNHQNKETTTDSLVPINDTSLSNICANPESDNDTENNTSVENEVTTDKELILQDFNEYEDEQTYLQNSWTPQLINESSQCDKPNVLDFMKVILNNYKYLLENLDEYNNFKDIDIEKIIYNRDYDEEEYQVILDIKNGFVSIFNNYVDDDMTCVMWNRSNGHVLIAFNWSSYQTFTGPFYYFEAILFYDYNPDTKILSIDSTLTNKFINACKKFDKHLGVKLPQKGKDIEVGWDWDDSNKIFKWNGYDFNFPK